MSDYPDGLDTFTPKTDGPGQYVYAAYFNTLQNALTAVQSTLGLNPQGTHDDVAAAIAAAAQTGGGGESGPSFTDLYQGPWTDTVDYVADDIVTHRGAAWIATAPNLSTEPGGNWGYPNYSVAGALPGTTDQTWTDQAATAFQVSTDTLVHGIEVAGLPAFIQIADNFAADPPEGAPVIGGGWATQIGDWSRVDLIPAVQLTAGVTYRVVYDAGAGWTATAATPSGVVTTVGNTLSGSNFETTHTDRYTPFRLLQDGDSPWTAFAGQPNQEQRAIANAVVPANDYATLDVSMSKAWRLMEIWTNRPVRIRIYDTDAHRTADLARPLGTPVDAATNHGVYYEANLTNANLYPVLYPPVHGSNREGTPISTTYVTLDNPDNGNQNITVTFFYVALA